ncbi:MAG: AAA family ATPase [Nitrososphaerales archaeon]
MGANEDINPNDKTAGTSPDFVPKLTVLGHDRITHLAHISDLHIPLNLFRDRADEFKSVFDKLLALLRELQLQGHRLAVVVTGDVIHVKQRIEAETIAMTDYLMERLADIAPTLVIAGNHDMIEKNLLREDMLTVLLRGSRVHYLRNSGLYQLGDLVFSVSSLRDRQFLRHAEIKHLLPPGSRCIALYHGTLTGSSTDLGQVFNNDAETAVATGSSRFRTLEDFRGYDAVLLGDIHKHQFLSPRIAYAGSLIQQDHGEKRGGHGMLLWDLTDDISARFFELTNDWGFVDVKVNDGKIETDLDAIASTVPRPRIRCLLNHTTSAQYLVLKDVIKQRLKPVSIKEQNVTDYQMANAGLIPETADFFEHEPGLIELELRQRHKEHLLDQIVELHRRYKGEVPDLNVEINNYSWRPISLEFKNVFIYGNNKVNRLNFDTGVTNIHAGNTSGKSSIVNIILVALYGKTAASVDGTKYIKNIYTSGDSYIKFRFLHGTNVYEIDRHLKNKTGKGHQGCTVNASLSLSVLEGDRLFPIHSVEPQKNIIDLIGTFELFTELYVLTNTFSQSILDMKDTERLSHVNSKFKLNVYQRFREINAKRLKRLKEEITTMKSQKNQLEQLGKLDRAEIEREIESFKAQLKQSEISRSKIEQDKKEINKKVDALQQLIAQKHQFLVKMTEPALSLVEIKNDLTKLKQQDRPEWKLPPIELLLHQLESAKKKFVPMPSAITVSGLEIDRARQKEILRALEMPGSSLEDCRASAITIKTQLQSIDREVKEHESKLEQLSPIDESVSLPVGTSPKELLKQIEVLSSQLHQVGSQTQNAIERECEEIRLQLKKEKVDVNLEEKLQRELGSQNYLIRELEERLRQMPVAKKVWASGSDRAETVSLVRSLRHRHDSLVPSAVPPTRAVDQTKLRNLRARLAEIDDKIKESNLPENLDELQEQCKALLENRTDDEIVQVPSIMLKRLYQAFVALKAGYVDANAYRRRQTIAEEIQAIELDVEYNRRCEQTVSANQLIYREREEISDELSYLERELLVSDKLEQERNRTAITSKLKQIKNQKRLNELGELKSKLDQNSELSKEIDRLRRQVDELEKREVRSQIYGLTERRETLQRQADGIQLWLDWYNADAELKHTEQMIALIVQNRQLEEEIKRLILQISVTKVRQRIAELEQMENAYAVLDANAKVQAEIEQLQKQALSHKRELADLEDCLSEVNHRLIDVNGHLQASLSQQKMLEDYTRRHAELTDRLQKLVNDDEVCESYKAIFDEKAIPSRILSLKIKSIEDLMNEVTKRYTKYEVRVSLVNATKPVLDFNVVYPSTKTSICAIRLSGFERLVFNLAIRRALSNLSYHAKSSLFIVDEQMDCIDKVRFKEELPEIIDILKMDFQNVFLISHRNLPAGIVDTTLKIEAHQTFSSVC